MTDNTSGDTPTHIDIGGMALPRGELVEVLPDIERFEAHLTDAIAVDSYMKNGDGSIPDYVRQWSQERIAAVVATLNEIGSLREQLIEQMGRQGGEQASDPQQAGDASASRTRSGLTGPKGRGHEH